jgi:hypothetical protein
MGTEERGRLLEYLDLHLTGGRTGVVVAVLQCGSEGLFGERVTLASPLRYV